ncbi:MAG: flagellar hook-associated protein FlgK [Vallitalea sp.]|jgi:flagellar hook-associated protein 1 FlgK|nr:flagellar hook-associated protein FlgK [Vallitalea sp.]
MSSISSLSRAVSGLSASQYALQATAHNLANVNTPGYVRQQVLLKESNYYKIGNNGSSNLMIGMGTDVQTIRQVRNMFLDGAFREESSRYGFYNSGAKAIEEIETIFGEIEGENMQGILKQFNKSLDELSKHPDGLEARGTFIQTAVLFVNKANLIMNQLEEYQTNLNTQITDKVKEVNRLAKEVNMLNQKISKYEINGDNANDFRDARNNALDQLSEIIDITYSEDHEGNVNVLAEGFPLVSGGIVNKIKLEQAAPNSPFVSPVWEVTGNRVFNLKTEISVDRQNDRGSLKGLLLSRGERKANYKDTENVSNYEENVKPSIIMRTQAKFDMLVHSIVKKVNDIVAPITNPTPPAVPEKDKANAPYGLDDSQHIEIFKRKNMSRYTGDTYNGEDASDINSLYSAGNLEINPEVLNDYDKICITKISGEVNNNELVEKIKEEWEKASIEERPGSTSKLNIKNYYKGFVGDIGSMGESNKTQMKSQEVLINQINNQRGMLMNVSSDEELGNMMKYQHAYNASARVITVVDQMLEQVISRLGLVGR